MQVRLLLVAPLTTFVAKQISKKWKRMQPLYRLFAESVCPNANLDFSDEAAHKMYASETHGKKLENPLSNGYYVGKTWLNVQVTEWRIDIANGLLFKFELYEDPVFQEYHWWLDKVLAGQPQCRPL